MSESSKQNNLLVIIGGSESRETVPENDLLDETVTLLLLLADQSEVEGDDPKLEDVEQPVH